MQNKINDKYGKWTLFRKINKRKWEAICECGDIHTVWIGNLKQSKSTQCVKCQGKLRSERGICNKVRSLYAVWCGIKRRCYNKNQKSFKDYGAKGVAMCDEWLNNYSAFHNWALSNGYKKGLEITRHKDIGNYSPENCSIKTRAENMKERVYKPTLKTLNNDSMSKTLLSWDDMCWLIKFGTSGRFKNKYIAEMFGVARHTVTDIIKRNGFKPSYITRK